MFPETCLPGSSLSLQVLRDGSAIQARIHGPLNSETAPLYGERLSSALSTGCSAIFLDLGGAEYVDSDGVRFLQKFRSRLGQQGIVFRLGVRAGSRVDRTLRLLKLDSDFLIERYPGEDNVRSLKAA